MKFPLVGNAHTAEQIILFILAQLYDYECIVWICSCNSFGQKLLMEGGQ